jgi:hypothetical protein
MMCPKVITKEWRDESLTLDEFKIPNELVEGVGC